MYCLNNPVNRVDPDGKQAPLALPFLETLYDVLFVGSAATATTMAVTHQNKGDHIHILLIQLLVRLLPYTKIILSMVLKKKMIKKQRKA